MAFSHRARRSIRRSLARLPLPVELARA